MMNEIKPKENSEIKSLESNKYREIKPENGTTYSESKQVWKNEFAKADIESPSDKTYYDDNGEKYREGNSLEPNTTFEKNGFTFQTDNIGRVTSVEGRLETYQSDKNRKMPSMDAVGKGEQKESDIRFHLIAHRFDGPDGIENLVAGDSKLNQGDYAKLENSLAEAVREGADVRMKVEPVYSGDSNRPDEFRVSYSIDGDKEVVVFKNRSAE